jgi:hypothetical protein
VYVGIKLSAGTIDGSLPLNPTVTNAYTVSIDRSYYADSKGQHQAYNCSFQAFYLPFCASVHFARLVTQSAVHSRKLKVGRPPKGVRALKGGEANKSEAFDRQESGEIAGAIAGKRMDRRRTCVSIAYYHLVSNELLCYLDGIRRKSRSPAWLFERHGPFGVAQEIEYRALRR